jgi:2-polyprenyl-3-methyl-5-hydroxy-6-metoxy-1,4-benzoquinol methylase
LEGERKAGPEGESSLSRIVRDRTNLGFLVSRVLAEWPEHEAFLTRSLKAHDDASLAIVEGAAGRVVRLMGDDAERFCEHYRWLCDLVNEETARFLRAGAYRCKTFAEAEANVYSNEPFMEKYMDGLLLSAPLWFNHARTYVAFTQSFLPALVPGADLLEIGPGHGLLLAQAASDPGIASVSAWDVSAESLRQTARALERLGVSRKANLKQRDLLAAPLEETFDAIVISEVLEHLEAPRNALESLVRHLRANGRIFINVPVNSPAPDHIYLLRTPEEATELVESAGLRVLHRAFEPMSGYSLARARARGATITCLFVAERAP